MDVVTAFLYGGLKERIYVEQPEGHVVPGKEDHVLLLLKSLYGLKQAPYVWFKTITSEFIKLGYRKCESDHGIWVKFGPNGKRTFIILYVDDLLIMTEDDEELASLKRGLTPHFEMKDLGEVKRFLGMEIEHESNGIKIHQVDYIHTLLHWHGDARLQLHEHANGSINKANCNYGLERYGRFLTVPAVHRRIDVRSDSHTSRHNVRSIATLLV